MLAATRVLGDKSMAWLMVTVDRMTLPVSGESVSTFTGYTEKVSHWW